MTVFEQLKNTETWSEFKYGNILNEANLNYIVHQANCFCCMGAGIAGKLAETYPMVATVDRATKKGDHEKLGTYSIAKVVNKNNKNILYIINLYSQFCPGKAVSGDDISNTITAINTGLNKLKSNILKSIKPNEIINIGFPWLIACGIYGLDEMLIYNIIKNIFEHESQIKITFVKYE